MRTLIAALTCLVFATAFAEDLHREIKGKPYIIDGDTIKIGHQRIRIHGIDAPEAQQRCTDQRGQWDCGLEAANALKFFLAGNWITCIEKDRDLYGRIVAVCYVGEVGGPDVGETMVVEGWAVAYRRFSIAYLDEEEVARNKGRGLWRGDFIVPWEWRRGKRLNF